MRLGRHLAGRLPVVEVPPLDVADLELDLGGAFLRLLTVHVVEPREHLALVLLDALDGGDELAALVGLDVGDALECLHGRLARVDSGLLDHDVFAAVAGDKTDASGGAA